MGIKIHTSLVIYLLLHNGHKYVLSQPNLTGSSIKSPNPSESGEQKSTNKTQNKQGVDLDIKSKKTTDQWSYTKNNKIHTYEAKGNNAFNKVKQGNTEIWNTTDSSQYASKVVYDESDSKNNTITITLLNGSSKKFKKGTDGNWSEDNGSGQTGDSNGSTTTTPGANLTGSIGSSQRSGTTPSSGTGSSESDGSQGGGSQPSSGTTGSLGSDGSGTGGSDGSDREHAKQQVKTEPQKKQPGPEDVEDEAKFNELVEAFKKDLNSDGKLKDSLGNDQSDSKNKIKALIKAENHVDVEVKVEGNDIGNNVQVKINKQGSEGETGIQDKSNSRIKKGGQYVNVIFEVKVDEDKNSKIAKRLREALMKAVGRDMTKTGTNSSSGDGTQGTNPATGTPPNPSTDASSNGSTSASNPANSSAAGTPATGTGAAASANPTTGNGVGTQGARGGGKGSQQPANRNPGGDTAAKPASAGTAPPSPPSGGRDASQGGRGGGK